MLRHATGARCTPNLKSADTCHLQFTTCRDNNDKYRLCYQHSQIGHNFPHFRHYYSHPTVTSLVSLYFCFFVCCYIVGVWGKGSLICRVNYLWHEWSWFHCVNTWLIYGFLFNQTLRVILISFTSVWRATIEVGTNRTDWQPSSCYPTPLIPCLFQAIY